MTAMDLEERLRRYGDTLDDALQEPPSSDYVPQAEPSTAPDEITTHPKRKLRVSVVAAVAAAILLVVGIAVVLTDGNSDDVVTDSDSSPRVADPVAPPGEAEPVPLSSVVDALGYRWSRVPHDDSILGDLVPFTAGMTDVTVGGPGLVAVGQSDDGAAVWTSVDGSTWSRVAHNEAVFGGENDQHMYSVTVGGPGFVAVGADDLYPDTDPERGDVDGRTGVAAVWTSVDGLTWSRVPHDDLVFGSGGHQWMNSVTAAGPGLVAVGVDGSGDNEDAAVWTSVDGLTWSRVAHDDLVFGGEHDQSMESVTVGGRGLVAVGHDGFWPDVNPQGLGYDDATRVAAVWTSADGVTWSRVPHDRVFGAEGNQWMTGVASTGSGLVAVGGDWSPAGHHAGVWISVDGIAWSRVSNDDAALGGEHDKLMLSVTPAGSGLLAVGRASSPSGNDVAASVWASPDGITWSWIGYDEAALGSLDNSMVKLSDDSVFTEYRQFMSSVIATSAGVVAVGADWSSPSHGAAVWVATPED